MTDDVTPAARQRSWQKNCIVLWRTCSAPRSAALGSASGPEDASGELADLLGQTGDLTARVPFMDHAALRCAHQLGLGGFQRRLGLGLVAARNRVLDEADVAAHA